MGTTMTVKKLRELLSKELEEKEVITECCYLCDYHQISEIQRRLTKVLLKIK